MIQSEKLLLPSTCTLTVFTTPSSATCQLYYNDSWHTEKSCTVPIGTTVQYQVSYSGYTTQSGSWTITEDTVKYVTLSQVKYTLTIQLKDSNGSAVTGSITLNGTTYSNVSSKSISVTNGTTVNYTIGALGNYPEKSGSTTVTSTKTLTAKQTTTTATGNYELTNCSKVGNITLSASSSYLYASGFTKSSFILLSLDPSTLADYSWTINLRFKMSTLSGAQSLMGGYMPSTDCAAVVPHLSGSTLTVYYGTHTAANRGTITSGTISTNTWYTLTITRSNATYTCSGAISGSHTGSATNKTSWGSRHLHIGGRASSDTAGTNPSTYATFDLAKCSIKSDSITYNFAKKSSTTSYSWTIT